MTPDHGRFYSLMRRSLMPPFFLFTSAMICAAADSGTYSRVVITAIAGLPAMS